MEALYLLVPFSVAVVFVALWVFFKASDSGQFDDMVGPALRILQDDDRTVTDGEADTLPQKAPQQAPQKTLRNVQKNT
jgi:cbb3-type cytochrome oxidase maturation protein